jgi:hypothetical protein
MKPFVLDSSMQTMAGVFYPTGYVVMMLPTREDARQAVKLLTEHGMSADTMTLLPPETVLNEIARTVGSADIPLPSPGTEADTVRQMTDFASNGHWGLMVYAPDQKDGDDLMAWLKGMPIPYAQKYRQLVIEDLVD